MVKRSWSWFTVFEVVGVLVAVALIPYTAIQWVSRRIDSAVEQKLSDPMILRKIASEARPSLIFDSKESITADLGGAQFVRNIAVVAKEKVNELAIDIEFTIHLPTAPLLTPMGADPVVSTSERGKGLGWHYRLQYISVLAIDGPPDDPNRRTAFRLELLR